MSISYFKYQSSGNNFILIDCISQKLSVSAIVSKLIFNPLVKNSDGLLFLSKSKLYDFKMSFYNPDGSKSFCGNGSLCSLHYLKKRNRIGSEVLFSCFGKKYSARITNNISLKMKNVSSYALFDGGYFIDSGAPHHIKFVDDADNFDLKNEADRIRNLSFYKENDCNVNLVSHFGNGSIYVRTFEKGVERETLSCGTGAVASVIGFKLFSNIIVNKVVTKGGELKVLFDFDKLKLFSNIYLRGNPQEEFYGKISF